MCPRRHWAYEMAIVDLAGRAFMYEIAGVGELSAPWVTDGAENKLKIDATEENRPYGEIGRFWRV